MGLRRLCRRPQGQARQPARRLRPDAALLARSRAQPKDFRCHHRRQEDCFRQCTTARGQADPEPRLQLSSTLTDSTIFRWRLLIRLSAAASGLAGATVPLPAAVQAASAAQNAAAPYCAGPSGRSRSYCCRKVQRSGATRRGRRAGRRRAAPAPPPAAERQTARPRCLIAGSPCGYLCLAGIEHQDT